MSSAHLWACKLQHRAAHDNMAVGPRGQECDYLHCSAAGSTLLQPCSRPMFTCGNAIEDHAAHYDLVVGPRMQRKEVLLLDAGQTGAEINGSCFQPRDAEQLRIDGSDLQQGSG